MRSRLLGLLLSLFPPISPAVAVATFRVRHRLVSNDVLWLASMVSFAVPGLLHRSAPLLTTFAGTIFVAWLLARFSRTTLQPFFRHDGKLEGLFPGVLAGLLTLAVLSSLETWISSADRASLWFGHPNTLGALGAVLGIRLLVSSRSIAFRLTALGGAGIVALASGSRAAFACLVLCTLVASALAYRGQNARALIAPLAALVITALLSITGASRIGTGLESVRHAVQTARSPNMIGSSENMDAWATPFVNVVHLPSEASPIRSRVFVLSKTGGLDGWRRAQTAVVLEPGVPYEIQVFVRPRTPASTPGIVGHNAASPDERSWTLTAALAGPARLDVQTRGPGMVHEASAEPYDSGWTRVRIVFAYTGRLTEGVTWQVGPAPDVADGGSGVAEFSAFQVTRFRAPSAYAPTFAIDDTFFESLSRVPIWEAAIRGFLANPWLGTGRLQVPLLSGAMGNPSQSAPHAHNLLLQAAYAMGILGVVGVALLLAAIARSSPCRAVGLVMALLVGCLGLVDLTPLSGAVLYPVAWMVAACPMEPTARRSP